MTARATAPRCASVSPDCPIRLTPPTSSATLDALQLGRYQILRTLATGGIADVLLARATGMEGFARHVVIKSIRPELARETQLVRAFLEEARIAASLHHQHIVQVHDIGEQDGAYFFAMEYVHGETVRALLTRMREAGALVPIEQVISIATATAAGLHYAHEQVGSDGTSLGVVHRDVAPSNILLGYDGSVKLVDFGLAKAALRSAKTLSGTLKGKASYMAPEQCLGRPIDRRADIFALGIVLYELATARRLFKGENEFLTMRAIVEGDIPPPSRQRHDLPSTFDAIVMRALARAPAERFQTADELRGALESFVVAHQLRTSSKATADYLVQVFGHRPEPWHADAEPTATIVADFDPVHTGVVELLQDDGDLAAPPERSPLAFARSIAHGGELAWSDEDEDAPTLSGPGAPAPEDDATTVAPPLFDELVDEPRPKPSTDAVYIGPPAPRPSRAMEIAELVTAHRRWLVIALAALATIVLFGIAIATCGGGNSRTDEPAGPTSR
jgi:serine/threonine protein kinase